MLSPTGPLEYTCLLPLDDDEGASPRVVWRPPDGADDGRAPCRCLAPWALAVVAVAALGACGLAWRSRGSAAALAAAKRGLPSGLRLPFTPAVGHSGGEQERDWIGCHAAGARTTALLELWRYAGGGEALQLKILTRRLAADNATARRQLDDALAGGFDLVALQGDPAHAAPAAMDIWRAEGGLAIAARRGLLRALAQGVARPEVDRPTAEPGPMLQWARLEAQGSESRLLLLNYRGPFCPDGADEARALLTFVRATARAGDAVVLVGAFPGDGYSPLLVELGLRLTLVLGGTDGGGREQALSNTASASLLAAGGGSLEFALTLGSDHATSGAGAPQPLTTRSAAPLLTFYAYRAQSDHSYELENIDAANLAGLMYYLHHEVVSASCPRHYNITRILRLKVTMRATDATYGSEGALRPMFMPFIALDFGACSGPGCPELWARYGFNPGCQFVTSNDSGPFRYSTGLWYSFPGRCPSRRFGEKTEACIAAEPGGQCAQPSGEPNCTWDLSPAGELRLDEFTGIEDYPAFCSASRREYVLETGRGVGFDFWDGADDAARCAARLRRVEGLFARRYPDAPAYGDPTCGLR